MGTRIAAGLVAVACAGVYAACAKASDPMAVEPDAAPMKQVDAAESTGVRRCPTGLFATAIDAAGTVTCVAPADPIKAAVGASCSMYLGWRDDCDACTTAPLKWGRAGATCENIGGDTTCTTQQLDGVAVRMFGLNLDGDMDGNDKLYGGLHCSVTEPMTSVAPCAPGQLVVGGSDTTWRCAAIDAIAASYVRDNCFAYLGWQDGCDGCTTAPVKWGRAGGTCQNGAGADNTCSTATLNGQTVTLFGLNPDGDVDGNDKLHIALYCNEPAPAMTTAMGMCPAGQFVAGTTPDGSIVCESLAPAVYAYTKQSCSLYFGWRDGCDGCLNPPTKWGKTQVAACEVGIGTDSTCNPFTLGGQMIEMFGVNPDGDVDGNDMLYVGLHCL